MSDIIINQTQGMTSLQVAEATGKKHKEVLRDIRSLLKQGAAERNFALTSYTDKSNRQSPMFSLTPKGCLILASGYDVVLREKIIDKLEELNAQVKVMERQLPAPTPAEVDASLRWIEGMRSALRLDGEGTWRVAVREARRLGLPEPPMPDTEVLHERPPRRENETMFPSEMEFGDAWNTAAVLLRRFGYKVTPAAFNARMIEKGWMARLEFYTLGGRKVKTTMLCEDGIRYGRNVALEGERAVAYCAELFPKLVRAIGLDKNDY